MTLARLAELLALLAAVAAALVLARRDRGHRRLAAGLCALAVDAVDRRVSDVGAELDSQRRPAIRPGPPKR